MTNKSIKDNNIVPDEPLSYLVEYKDDINKLSLSNDKKELMSNLNAMLKILNRPGFFTYYLNLNLKEEAKKQVKTIENEIKKFENLLSEFKSTTADFLRMEEKSYLNQSYQMYERAKEQDDSVYILDRTLFHTLIYRDEIEDKFINLIRKYSNWKHPGMFIRPEHGKFVNEMTASDPLYVVDEKLELLEPVKKIWSSEYLNRVRFSIINDDDHSIFKNIPKEQLGFVTAMNFFNHKPIEVIKIHLTEIFKLLKPGGVVLFTFNNCNLPLAVRNFEKSLYSYTPETLLSPLIEMLGFDIIDIFNDEKTNVSWLEIKKPGNLTSLRGGQCLGKINV